MLKLLSPAKINLGLKVLKKRKDGYHEIVTIFQKISLADTLTFSERKIGIKLTCNDPRLPTDENNLVYRAAFLLKEHYQIQKGIHIQIKKNIPIAAGLGGGSSNAACCLMGLNQLWELNLKKKELYNLALKLGADCHFFLSDSSTALAKGIGEKLFPFRGNCPLPIVLVNPGFGISTAWAYQALSLALTNINQDISMLKKVYAQGNIEELSMNLFNDLEPAVIKKYPVIANIKKGLFQLGAKGTLMSGSGSTVFGVFAGAKEALNAYRIIKSKNKYFCHTEIINNY